MPGLPVIARLTRRYQADAVRLLLARGVRQFLDIGTGLPAAGSVHEIAQRDAPESRVVYDNDPLVLTHARALLTSSAEGACDYIEADLREPGKILGRAARTLDLSEPVGVLLIAVHLRAAFNSAATGQYRPATTEISAAVNATGDNRVKGWLQEQLAG
jgi:hypothetical protein